MIVSRRNIAVSSKIGVNGKEDVINKIFLFSNIGIKNSIDPITTSININTTVDSGWKKGYNINVIRNNIVYFIEYFFVSDLK